MEPDDEPADEPTETEVEAEADAAVDPEVNADGAEGVDEPDAGSDDDEPESEMPAPAPAQRVRRVVAVPTSQVGWTEQFAPPTLGWRRTGLAVTVLAVLCAVVTVVVLANGPDTDSSASDSPRTTADTTAAPETSTTAAETTTTTAALQPIDLEEAGQGCTQIANKGYSYADALSYYLRTGEPERMDPDHDDIPCESNYSEEDKQAVWAARAAAGESVPAGVLE